MPGIVGVFISVIGSCRGFVNRRGKNELPRCTGVLEMAPEPSPVVSREAMFTNHAMFGWFQVMNAEDRKRSEKL